MSFQRLQRTVVVFLCLTLGLGGRAFAGREIESAFKESAVEAAVPSVRTALSAGYASKYIFRGTNLAPESDGLVWGEGTVSVSPWDNGTFAFGFWAGSQVGRANFDAFRATGPFPSESQRLSTDFTARDKTVPRSFSAGNLEVRERDRAFLSDLFEEAFSGGGGVQRDDFFEYLTDAYAYLRHAPGPIGYPYYRPPIFVITPGRRGFRTGFATARMLGFPRNAEGYIRASGYRGPLPRELTTLEREIELTQRDLNELRLPLSYRHEAGALSITLTNTFYYAQQEIDSREILRERFASDAAREFIDFASNTDIYVGTRIPTSGAIRWRPQLVAPMLPIRPGHPEDFLRNQTIRRRVTAREMYDRLDLELGANSKWLVDHGHAWARYLRPRATFSQTLYSDVDTGDTVLPSYSSADHGSYATLQLDAHFPLRCDATSSVVHAPTRTAQGLPWNDRLSLDISTLTSASFGDRPGDDGDPVRGWHHFEVNAELNWWITPTWRVAPSINYYALFSEPAPGTERNSFWYGLQCEVIF